MLVSMICMMFSFSVLAEESETFMSGEYGYALLEDGTAEITHYNGDATELVVPGELDEYAVTSIRDNFFPYCASLSSITLPEGLTNIGESAFYNCESLSSITLPEGLKSIGDSAFSYCGSLNSITLPDSIETMGVNPFSGDIINIKISPDHPNLAIIDGVLFSKSDKRLVYFPDTKEEYVVPNGIQSIGDWAFNGCNSLSSITLPEGLTSIGKKAFFRCFSLSSITLPEGLTSIGDSAFSNCESLSSITLPEGLTSIGDSAFSYCISLNSITLPEGLTSIEDGAFRGCNSLTITVNRDSYAAEYCKENGLNYTYPDANDWLNS